MATREIKVLIIEDNKDDYFLIDMLLSKSKTHTYNVSTCTSCTEVTKYNASMFDVILLDLSLGDSFGVHSLQMLKANYDHDVPVIAITNMDKRLALDVLDLGAQDFILKQELNTNKLETCIQYAMARYNILKKNQELSYKDSLTGLYNRNYFDVYIKRVLNFHSNYTGNGAHLLFMDLNCFKEVNDLFGHMYGDEVLKDVGERLRCLFKESDLLFRIGGDEFCALMRDVSKAEVSMLLKRIVEEVERPFTLVVGDSFYKVDIGVSIGVANISSNVVTANDLIQQADCAMYEAKFSRQTARSNYKFYDALVMA